MTNYRSLVWKWNGKDILLSKLKPAQLECIKNLLTNKKGLWYGHSHKVWINSINMIERDTNIKIITETIVKRRQLKQERANIIADGFLTKLFDLNLTK